MGKKRTLIKELKRFADDILIDYSIKKMILFGSRAWGKPHKDSDVDLLIVSDKFRRKGRLDRSPSIYLRWNLDYPVDFLCLTSDEFNKKKKEISIVKEAAEKGVKII